MTRSAKKRLSRWVSFVENRIFPLIFLYFAWVHVNVLFGYHRQIGAFFWTLFDDPLTRLDFNFGTFVVLRVMLLMLNVEFALGLLTRARTEHEFDDWKEVVIPVLCSGYGFLANALMYSHARINFLVVPPHLAPVAGSLGILVVLLGSVLSIVATWQLRRSFSVFVESHPVVDGGVYRYMRHPLYVGHGLRLVGYSLMNGFFLYVVVSLSTIGLLYWRAVMEERRLSRDEPEYAAYRRRTPGLFAGLGAAASPVAARAGGRKAAVEDPA